MTLLVNGKLQFARSEREHVRQTPDLLAHRVLEYCRAKLGVTVYQRIEWHAHTLLDGSREHGCVYARWPHVLMLSDVLRDGSALEIVDTVAHEFWHSYRLLSSRDADEHGADKFGRQVAAEWHAGGLA